MGASFPLAWPLSHDVIDSAGLPCFVAGAHRCGTRHTAVLEGTLRSGIRPSTFAGQRLNAATGGAKHGVCHLATGIGDEQVKLGSGGNVEHGLVRLVCSQYRPWRGVWARALCQLVGWHIKSLFVTFIGKDTLLPNQHSPEDTLDPLSIADQILPP